MIPEPDSTKTLHKAARSRSKRIINYRWRLELQCGSDAAPVDMPRGGMCLPQVSHASNGTLFYLSQLIGRTSKSSPRALPRSISCNPRD
ncbi:hypothetical protein CGRA01v4_02367 [Colletotrichum graminicola]|nr:hypothetical protein CGRA01v4_02367 [Colletotrichum graminicola]